MTTSNFDIINLPILLAQSDGGQGILPSFLPLIFIFLIFYFLLIRPQSKKQKKLNEKKNLMKKGDKIVLNGGIYGSVVGFKGQQDEVALVEIAKGVNVEVIKATILDVVISEEEFNKRANNSTGKGAAKDKTANTKK